MAVPGNPERALLERLAAGAVSGSTLAGESGLTRAAVWKRIAALREAGIAYLGLHYTRIDKRVGADEADAGRAGWQAWRQLLASTYPQRLQAFESNQCSY